MNDVDTANAELLVADEPVLTPSVNGRAHKNTARRQSNLSDFIAEKNVAGAFILTPRLRDQAGLHDGLFVHPGPLAVFKASGEMKRAGQPIDAASLALHLKAAGVYEDIGGLACLREMMEENQAAPSRFPEYLERLRERHRRREIYHAANMIGQAVDTQQPTADLAAEALELFKVLGNDRADRPLLNRIGAEQLATDSYAVEFHIPGILVAGQPQGMFGAKKSLKTSLMLDMAISIATGRPWLGYFHVGRPAKVAVFSGESGLATIQETCRRISAAANVELADTGIAFYSSVPIFGDVAYMDALEQAIVRDKTEVLFIDPTYLALKADGREGSLFAMGELLRGVSELCQRLGCTLVLLHHMRKGVADPYAPGDLDDASWAGFAEFCRGWLLINRREKYEPGSGMHRLWLSVGGSVGHSGLWGVDIFEGVYTGRGSRTWRVQVLKADEVRQGAAEHEASTKAEKVAARIDIAKRAIVQAMAKYPAGETERVIKDTAGVSGSDSKAAFAALVQDGSISPCTIEKGNRRTPYEGYKLNLN